MIPRQRLVKGYAVLVRRTESECGLKLMMARGTGLFLEPDPLTGLDQRNSPSGSDPDTPCIGLSGPKYGNGTRQGC
jgi:hypothetical protein